MKPAVSTAIDELKVQFEGASFTVRPDSDGGAYVIMDGVSLGRKFSPEKTWLGFHVPAIYPYADIYPVFVNGDVSRTDGRPFAAPITAGHSFEGRAALQISRRNGAAQTNGQRATAKILKILDFLEHLT